MVCAEETSERGIKTRLQYYLDFPKRLIESLSDPIQELKLLAALVLKLILIRVTEVNILALQDKNAILQVVCILYTSSLAISNIFSRRF